jgi:hypothetical protein
MGPRDKPGDDKTQADRSDARIVTETGTRISIHAIPGGSALLERFGACNFHDSEIVSLELQRAGRSILKVRWWREGFPFDAAVAAFHMQSISDLSLSGFSSQNVLAEIALSRRGKDPARKDWHDFCATDDDYHLELKPSYGMDGFIRCSAISVTIEHDVILASAAPRPSKDQA